jgi:2,3-bisphosphoglycerate-dependent phosphoglycerate mutase
MGRWRRDDGIAAVFASDLRRAAETAEIAFGDTHIPILNDRRLRECDLGVRNGSPTAEVKQDLLDYRVHPYPGGESHAHGGSAAWRGPPPICRPGRPADASC